jgi:drug/metabolite transporter (DMT)-like permease
LYALAAMLFWGMSFVWTTILLRFYEPITIILIRLILSAAFLFILSFFFGRIGSIRKKDLLLLILSSFFNPFLYFFCENYGVKFSTSTVAAVIIATIPLFSPVAAWFYFRERLYWFNIAGIVLSFIGILVMLAGKEMAVQAGLKGILFLSGAVVSAVFYSVTLKRLALDYTPITLIFWQNLIGILFFIPFFFIFEFRQFLTVVPTRESVTSFLFLSILCSSVSFVFYTRSVRELGISKANIFSNLIPVFTAIFSFFILSESFTLLKIAGILIVITGVTISELNRRRKPS